MSLISYAQPMRAVAINTRQEGYQAKRLNVQIGSGMKPNIAHTNTDNDGALNNEATHKCLNDEKNSKP